MRDRVICAMIRPMGQDANTPERLDADVAAFTAALDHPTRRADAEILLPMFARLTGWPAKMWGPTIIGFGRYASTYDSGHSGQSLVTGFSPRKASQSIYIMPGYQDLSEPLSRLGKHKIGKACLYINKLADVDLDVLEEIITHGITYMKANYEVTER